SRYKGGDVGWFDQDRTEYRWPSEVVSAGFALTNGAVSEVIKAKDGFYLVSRLDWRDAVVTPLEKVRFAIERTLLSTTRQQTEAAYVQKLRAVAPIQTYADNFARVQYPTTSIAKADEPMPPMLQGTTISKKAN